MFLAVLWKVGVFAFERLKAVRDPLQHKEGDPLSEVHFCLSGPLWPQQGLTSLWNLMNGIIMIF